MNNPSPNIVCNTLKICLRFSNSNKPSSILVAKSETFFIEFLTFENPCTQNEGVIREVHKQEDYCRNPEKSSSTPEQLESASSRIIKRILDESTHQITVSVTLSGLMTHELMGFMEGMVEKWNESDVREFLTHLHFEFSLSRIITAAEMMSVAREIVRRMTRSRKRSMKSVRKQT